LRVNYDVAVTSVTDASFTEREVSTVYDSYEEPASMGAGSSMQGFPVAVLGAADVDGVGSAKKLRDLEIHSGCDALYEIPVVNSQRPPPPPNAATLVLDRESTVA
jgi:hypothetical protein